MILHNICKSFLYEKKNNKKNNLQHFSFPATHLMICMYVKYCTEVKGVSRASIGKSHFVILFLTSVVHNSVVYAVLYVTRKKMFGIICTFFVPLRDIHEKILKEIRNVMNNVN